MKPGKDGLTDLHKYRPISLIHTGGKLLEKLLINRINLHVHTNRLLNRNQYGFIPQSSTVDASMAVKQYALSHIQQKKYDIMVSLDVQGAFDAAWWPSICATYVPSTVLEIYTIWLGATSVKWWRSSTLIHAE